MIILKGYGYRIRTFYSNGLSEILSKDPVKEETDILDCLEL